MAPSKLQLPLQPPGGQEAACLALEAWGPRLPEAVSTLWWHPLAAWAEPASSPLPPPPPRPSADPSDPCFWICINWVPMPLTFFFSIVNVWCYESLSKQRFRYIPDFWWIGFSFSFMTKYFLIAFVISPLMSWLFISALLSSSCLEIVQIIFPLLISDLILFWSENILAWFQSLEIYWDLVYGPQCFGKCSVCT